MAVYKSFKEIPSTVKGAKEYQFSPASNSKPYTKKAGLLNQFGNVVSSLEKGVVGAIKGVARKVVNAGSFEPNYIENKAMPKQAADFKKSQQKGAPK